jgi:hypothetical protein
MHIHIEQTNQGDKNKNSVSIRIDYSKQIDALTQQVSELNRQLENAHTRELCLLELLKGQSKPTSKMPNRAGTKYVAIGSNTDPNQPEL